MAPSAAQAAIGRSGNSRCAAIPTAAQEKNTAPTASEAIPTLWRFSRPTEIDHAWRFGTTVTFEVNPTLEFHISYPPATPECFAARNSEVVIEKTASVEKTEPGRSFTYSIDVENVSTSGAADGVVVTDAIPADIKVTDVSWAGEGDASVFPNWTACAVAGQSAAGYGGTLTCASRPGRTVFTVSLPAAATA